MSAPSPNSRRKRSQSPSTSTNNSFVKSVTERVSGLLPASISKWFSSPKSANGNSNAADITDSSTDDEDAPITTQPPLAKRMRFNSPVQHNQFSSVEPNWVPPNSFDVKEPPSVPHSSIQSPPVITMIRHESNYVPTPIRAVNEESFVEKNEQDSSTFRMQHSITSRGLSVAKKRELICQSRNECQVKKSRNDTAKETPKINKTQEPKQPYFKASLLSSPFYSGRTMYGGASSFYMNESNIKQKKVTLLNESNANDTITMSHSTKTIMDLLENYSSPLSEARRLPQYIKKPNSDKSNTIAKLSSPDNKDAYKTRELYVPNIASIIQIKQRSRLMDTTSIARQLIASHSSTIGVNPYPVVKKKQHDSEVDTIDSLRQHRLKTKLTRKGREFDKYGEDIPAVNLPDAVLHIEPNKLSNFSATLTVPTTSITATTTSSMTSTSFLNTPPVTSTMVFSTSIPITIGESRATYSKANNVSSKGMFKFSDPDPVVTDLLATTILPPSCKFGSTEQEKDYVSSLLHSSKDQEGVTVLPNAKKDPILLNMLKEQKHSDSSVNDKSDIDKCLSSGSKKSEAAICDSMKCRVCKHADAQKHSGMCTSCEMKKNDTAELKPKENVTWKCDDCWVSNKETNETCVCCGTTKPNSLIPVTQKSTANTFENDWKCINCSILNKDSLERCVNCGETKTTSKVNNTGGDSSLFKGQDTQKTTLFSSIKSTDDVFANIVKSQKNDKWECPSCLVKNEHTKNVCICCGTEREKENAVANKILFNFNTNENCKFKFGIYDNESEETEIDNLMEEESLPEVPKSIETADNTIIEEMSTISSNFEEKAEFSKETDDESNKVKFVLPETESVLSLDIEQTPSQNSNSNVEKDNSQDMPKINFEPEEKYDQNSFFELYTSNSKDLNTSKSISFMAPLIISQDNKSSKEIATIPAYPLQAITTTSSQVSPSQNNFRFSTSELNLSGNPFESSVATTPITTISFLMPSQSVSTTIAASTIGDTSIFPKPKTNISDTASLFSKKDDVPTTAIPLFQKSESGIKTVQTTATTAPVFNFGCNTQTSILSAPVEKPKFSFVFGTNATENSTMFKRATFGAMPDNDAGSNRFILSSDKTSVAGTGLFGNTLSGNGLPSGSTLTAVTLPTTNSLRGNTDASVSTNSGANTLQTNTTMTGVFGTSGQKENMWSSNNNMSNNLFVANTTVNTLQKPSPFTFGTSSPFNANSSTPSFGSNTQATQNLFGIPSQTKGTQPAMFSSAGQNQTTSNIFGSPTSASNPAPSLATIFGTQNVGAPPAFGSTNPPIPSFEAPSVNPAPTPAFNFGAPPSTNILSFGQQQQTQQAGVFGFVGNPAAAPQVHFNMGTAPNTAMRRVRKAVRRNPQR